MAWPPAQASVDAFAPNPGRTVAAPPPAHPLRRVDITWRGRGAPQLAKQPGGRRRARGFAPDGQGLFVVGARHAGLALEERDVAENQQRPSDAWTVAQPAADPQALRGQFGGG